jgi:hypothetical protein
MADPPTTGSRAAKGGTVNTRPNRGGTLFGILVKRPISRLPLKWRMGLYRWWYFRG